MSRTRFVLDQERATITLDQPEKHNAFDDAVIEELLVHIENIHNNHDVRVLVLQAEGKHFCAGADLAWMKRMADMNYDENLADAQNLANLMASLNSLPIPTIVRVQGAAYGGALGLIACCDIAIASDRARFCLSEARLGLAPATIGPYVYAAIGERNCRRLFLTAEVFSAAQAKDYGLVHEIVEQEQLDEKIETLVQLILETGPGASRACKQLVHDIKLNHEDLLDKTGELIAMLRVSEEGQEGLSAFFDKRPPAWRK